jgi:DNA-binding transcriptional regulator LsrR (DeoR family)
MFFDRQLTKVEIAARLGISRFRVARLLDRALEEGIVRIEFRDGPSEDRELARAVEDRFGLRVCAVASDPDDPIGATARLAGGIVAGLIGAGDAIGIAWGSTVARVVAAIPIRDDPSIDVVQLAGSSARLETGADPGDLTRVLAERLGARPHRLTAPAFLESSELRAALAREPDVAATMRTFDHLAVAVVGIGAFGPARARPNSSLVRSGALGAREIDRLVRKGAVGDLLVHPFDGEGRFVAPDLARRAMAIGVEQLRNVGTVVAVAAGGAKVGAIRGAVATGIIDILVTDRAAAEGLLG